MFRISFNFDALMKENAKPVRLEMTVEGDEIALSNHRKNISRPAGIRDDWAEEQARVDAQVTREEMMQVFSEKFAGKAGSRVA
ncbi:hypothetical protein AQS8620_00289 [Aquimixticola soesokkakensis]|uniref:Uncharacterized protein n=1 Tax=Aquimixticola soesokkakensis TaxID=1519096 RepID=A0A1Y5RII2_9RHOB|nr:hypothetical protein [Aquimixticola soesokkakensis]SLN15512.1 hypothetical protein AQS8620_00289 [Aquimixticola soesokkakensis]